MALQLGRAFGDGIKRVLTRTGGLLFVLLLALQVLIQTSINTVVVGLFPPGPAGEIEAAIGLTLPVSGRVAGVIFGIAVVLSSAYFVVLARALARPMAALSTFPSELYTRRVGRATLAMLVGGFVVGFAVVVGTALFFLPGIFLSVCFLFFIFAAGVEDRGVIGSLKRSWGLSRGNRLKLGVVVLLAGIVGAVVGVTGSLLDLADSPIVAELASNTLSSVLFMLLYGIMASAYLQVRDDGSAGSGRAETAEPAGHRRPVDR